MMIAQQKIDGIGMTSKRTRMRLVDRLREKGIIDERVLSAMARVPRHLFVDEAIETRAYEDTALPIGHGQTISQPYVVALMTQSILEDGIPHKVLEVGTGSGYQAALLAQLVPQVFTVERIDDLLKKSRTLFYTLKYNNIKTNNADGGWGWQVHAPYDAIVVTAAPESIPGSLLDQLAIGGKLIIPVGRQGEAQSLLQVLRQSDGYVQKMVESVNFVPFLPGKVSA